MKNVCIIFILITIHCIYNSLVLKVMLPICHIFELQDFLQYVIIIQPLFKIAVFELPVCMVGHKIVLKHKYVF